MWKTQITQQQLGFVCGSERLTRLITENFIVANVLIFETTGAFIVAYAFVVYGGYSNEMTYPYIYILLTGGISFAALLWSGRYCSPTLNPAVTLAYIFKGEKKIIPLIGCLYLACEFLGTLAGGVLGFTMIQDYDVPAMTYLTAAVYSCDSTAAFFQSFLSSFVFIVIILIMTTPSVSFTQMDLQIWFAMTLLYGITAVLGNCPLGSNFFLTLVISFLGGCFNGEWGTMHRVWALILGPLLGCVVGIVFFEYFYQPVAQAYKEELSEQSEEEQQQEEERRRELRNQSILQIA